MTGFRVIRKWSEPHRTPLGVDVPGLRCEYEAGFWEGPLEPGQVGQRVTRRVLDRVSYSPSGHVLGMANTAPSVSYYSQLKKSLGLH